MSEGIPQPPPASGPVPDGGAGWSPASGRPPATPAGPAPPGPPGHGHPPYGHPYGGPPHVGRQGDETTWAMMSYVGAIVVGVPAPLIVYFVKRRESPFVRFHAAQCLNLTITAFVYIMGCVAVFLALFLPLVMAGGNGGGGPASFALSAVVAIGIGLLAVLAVAIAQIVYLILAIIHASRYEWYRIPTWICWRMVR